MEENEKPKSNDGCFNVGCLFVFISISICGIVGSIMSSGVHEFQYLGYFVIGIAIAVGLYFLVKYILNVSQEKDEPIIDNNHNYEEYNVKNNIPNKTKEPNESPKESTWGCILTIIAVIVGLVLFALAVNSENFSSIIGIIAFASITLYFGYRLYRHFMDN